MSSFRPHKKMYMLRAMLLHIPIGTLEAILELGTTTKPFIKGQLLH